jgi:hypothetical protein
MVCRALTSAILVASSLALWSGGTADAKGICVDRALEQGYAYRDANEAIIYRPYLPTADDYKACGLAVPATAVVAAPGFAG